MSSNILHGTINLSFSSSTSNKEPSFGDDEALHVYIEDISQVPKTENAQEHPKSNGSILLGETKIQLGHNNKFPLKFECEYDPTKASHGEFDKLCKKGLIIIGADINAEGREMTMFWLKSGEQKFEQNIKLTLTDSY
ncbi:unnamed protein product [Adineta steineri]|uniref:Uncharacterized protein n=2 Tax=Adineta steineri TaxID=433720 RepID=A0A814NW88_9BILA|nr:unnamed protein product [Adineta steineri]